STLELCGVQWAAAEAGPLLSHLTRVRTFPTTECGSESTSRLVARTSYNGPAQRSPPKILASSLPRV
ncbi:hypothetical protein ACLOJK_012944, partial [Asimina triloba]